MGFKTIFMDDLINNDIQYVIDTIKENITHEKIYISIDVDVCDPAFAPGTGTPEIGGLQSRELIHIIRSLEGYNIVGADIVEVIPSYDNADITSQLA